jgi:hypothetical protein
MNATNHSSEQAGCESMAIDDRAGAALALAARPTCVLFALWESVPATTSLQRAVALSLLFDADLRVLQVLPAVSHVTFSSAQCRRCVPRDRPNAARLTCGEDLARGRRGGRACRTLPARGHR